MTSTTTGTTDNDRDKLDERLAVALRRLIARCRDSAASYRKAAEETSSAVLQPEFERIAHERDRLVEALTGIAKDLGVDIAKESDRAVDDVHRAFLGFKVKLLGGDANAILAEVARGESALEHLFRRALHFDMPRSVRRQLQDHHHAVRQARDYYRVLARRMRQSRASMSRRMSRVGSTLRQHPLATVGVIAASALVLGTVAVLSTQDRPRWNLDTRRLRGFEKRLRRLEDRALRQIEDYRPRDLERRARRGLERIGRHLGGYR